MEFSDLEQVASYLREAKLFNFLDAPGCSGNFAAVVDYGGSLDGEERALTVPVPKLEGRCIAVSRSGVDNRVKGLVHCDFGIIHINSGGKTYTVVHGLPRGEPTSELPAQLSILEAAVARGDLVSLHDHPVSVQVLMQLIKQNFASSLGFTLDSVVRANGESAVFLVDGIGFVDKYLPNGSVELAEASRKAAKKHKVILWYQHGAVYTGRDFSTVVQRREHFLSSTQIVLDCLVYYPHFSPPWFDDVLFAEKYNIAKKKGL